MPFQPEQSFAIRSMLDYLTKPLTCLVLRITSNSLASIRVRARIECIENIRIMLLTVLASHATMLLPGETSIAAVAIRASVVVATSCGIVLRSRRVVRSGRSARIAVA